MTPQEESAMFILQSFEKLKTFKPEHTSITIGNVTASSSDVEVEIINEDPNSPENDPNGTIIECFGFDVDVSVIDAGIGAYEFWGAKGNDSHMQNEVQSLKMTDPWPEELTWLRERIEEKICDSIAEADLEDSHDGDDFDPDPDDAYDRYYDR